ncbi:sigma-54-dependent transcriptional regulator [Pseudomarimonas salicorniae]|uniref:Sigma-54 dependent transcriptional regulator n=1 Tax=Pseudomarimonas salicorniae TaxID=2933270 RepID=A0ABT0GEF7_9GAMM|nr:sigma-54 dependent transcriptional regulator [Lysobacter sp. CAU 1642]MCK7592407.1 sigma-54 dependent transcriptional regulator [Lysobacter sp. CAU 1642]
MPAAQVLVVDDEPDIRQLVQEILEDEGYAVRTAAHAEAARSAVAERVPDAILLDIWMPETDGVALLREWAEGPGLPCPVVMMSGHGTVETAVEATRLGAWDFIEKPIALAKLLITLQRALEAGALREANQALRAQILPELAPVGDSAPIRALREQLGRLARHEAPVLLRGEAGTRKESLARWLHQLGDRRDGPFVTVAAGAISEAQAASTLFGAEEGGVVSPGLLERAQGGSLFLDEVAALGPELQRRLCAALERRELLRVGGLKPVPLDVRVIAATAMDLEAERAAGRFLDELYFQIAVVPVEVPALRDCVEDIPELVSSIVEQLARQQLPPREFSTAALKRLARHDWPGNARELRNLVQRLLLLGEPGPVSLAEVESALGQRGAAAREPGEGFEVALDLPLREARERFERHYLLQQLQTVGGSVGKLAKLAGVERTHLYRKLKELGVDIRASREA